METIYMCEHCGGRVLQNEGYIHSRRVGEWHIHHRGCADFTDDVCFAVPRHWSDLFDAHMILTKRTTVHA